MTTTSRKFIIAGIIAALSAPLAIMADDAMNVPSGDYQHQLGTAKLADPSGATHSKAEVAGKVVVAIFSAPNMSQGDKQQKWADLLETNPQTKVSSRVSLILVEDMSQAGMFKGMARSSMKKDFVPGSRPFLILDESGDVLKRFGVAKGTTQVLIYDKTGKLRDVESNLDDEKTADQRIKVISAKLLAE